jgi:hypothetical protein
MTENSNDYLNEFRQMFVLATDKNTTILRNSKGVIIALKESISMEKARKLRDMLNSCAKEIILT